MSSSVNGRGLSTAARIALGVTCAAILAAPAPAPVPTPDPPLPARPPADVTALQDRAQMMAQLGVRFPADLPSKATDLNRPPVPLHPRDPNSGHTPVPDWPAFVQFARKYWTR
jgi:hypothetical protein